MKIIIIGLMTLSYLFTFAGDYEISKKKSIIKLNNGKNQVFDIKITESLDKFVIVFEYEYWGETCDQYKDTRINNPQDEYKRKTECVRYKRGLIQATKRLRIIDITGASGFVIETEQRGYNLNLYLVKSNSSKKKLKKNFFGNYKLKI